MDAQFDFYEIVKIKKTDFTVKNGIDGLKGAILGKADNEDGHWFYAVNIYGNDEGWDLPEECLESTGGFTSEEEFYDGTSIHVKVDPETGEGNIED